MGAKTFVIHLGDVQAEVYLMSGFFHSSTAKESPLHSHQYPEVHFVEEGACRFLIGDDTFDCQAGDVVILPAHQLHRTYLLDNHTRHNAFLLNYPVKRVSRSAVEPRLLRNLGSLIREYREGNDFGAIAPFVTFLCEKGIKRRLQLKPVENRSFLISEFFENRYHQDVGLADLSEELGLSIKQTARLVQKHMGDSFSRVLARLVGKIPSDSPQRNTAGNSRPLAAWTVISFTAAAFSTVSILVNNAAWARYPSRVTSSPARAS